MSSSKPTQFIDEPIEVRFDVQPTYEKKPHCPQEFNWRGESFTIERLLEEWADFRRRGRMARNMRTTHLVSAAQAGSWGVGRYYFRVTAAGGRIFDIYFDRAPESAGDTKGHWFLLGERLPAP
jgi:hypothetical protein